MAVGSYDGQAVIYREGCHRELGLTKENESWDGFTGLNVGLEQECEGRTSIEMRNNKRNALKMKHEHVVDTSLVTWTRFSYCLGH